MSSTPSTITPNLLLFVDRPGPQYSAQKIADALRLLAQEQGPSLLYAGRDTFDTRNRGYLLRSALSNRELLGLLKDFFARADDSGAQQSIFDYLGQYSLLPLQDFDPTTGHYKKLHPDHTYVKDLGPINDEGKPRA